MIHLARTAAVCVEAQLQGPVTMGGTVRCASGCFFVLFRRSYHPGNNLFESGCVVQSRRVGDGNWFEPKSQAQKGSVIGSNCFIGSGVVVAAGEHIRDNTILVVVQTPQGDIRRVTREQKDYLIATHAGLIQKYADIFPRGSKSAYALEKHHELRQ
ncbi:unnamed protein product [Peronospora farinosa]|uniref:Dynactin subunit 6 n=1 Tax=Peronospora farinosa TaxID=134698 RepID=A0ABN8CD93_9STRA|nr:unnamed protein product [Peronospora farinosa]